MLLLGRQPLFRILAHLAPRKQEQTTPRSPRITPATRFQPAGPHPYSQSQAPEAVLDRAWWSAPFSWR
jgi:hypothetical protein